MEEQSPLNVNPEDEASLLRSDFYLEHVGMVNVTFHPDELSWRSVEPLEDVSIFKYGVFIHFTSQNMHLYEFLGTVKYPDLLHEGCHSL